MVVNLLLSGTREHTYRPPRVTFALYRLFSLLLILELIFCSFWISLLCTVNGMPMKHPQNYIHLQKVNCLCFIFLIRFLCVCVCYSLSLSFVSGTSLLECVYFIHSLIYIRLHPIYFVHAENVIHHLHHLIEANTLENATREMTNCRTYHE